MACEYMALNMTRPMRQELTPDDKTESFQYLPSEAAITLEFEKTIPSLVEVKGCRKDCFEKAFVNSYPLFIHFLQIF